jgi:hypothetical protein
VNAVVAPFAFCVANRRKSCAALVVLVTRNKVTWLVDPGATWVAAPPDSATLRLTRLSTLNVAVDVTTGWLTPPTT